jgi:hypothetical protein
MFIADLLEKNGRIRFHVSSHKFRVPDSPSSGNSDIAQAANSSLSDGVLLIQAG